MATVDSAHVVVITDDDEIISVAEGQGARTVFESTPVPPEETLDSKILRNIPVLRGMGAVDDDIVVTVQPTSPLLKASSIRRAVSLVRESGDGSVLSVVDDRHLRWTVNASGVPQPEFEARLNRQQLPSSFRETGGVLASRLGDIERSRTRIVPPVRLLELPQREAVDIDDFADLYAAAHLLTQLRIMIRTDAAQALGMGHAYRTLSMAAELARHELSIWTRRDMPLGKSFFSQYPYLHQEIEDESDFIERARTQQPDVIIVDVLDYDVDVMSTLRSACPESKIVSVEDSGPAAERAHVLLAEFVANAFVPPDRVLSGAANSILSPAFETCAPIDTMTAAGVEHIVVLFGGTDPSGLASKALDSLSRCGFTGEVSVIRGLGASDVEIGDRPYGVRVLRDVKNMPKVLRSAQFAYTSAGRTVFELATMGVPAICLAQNKKEMTHTHATSELGVWNLGLGTDVAQDLIDRATHEMLHSADLRSRLRTSALHTMAGRSNRSTLARVLEMVGLGGFPNL